MSEGRRLTLVVFWTFVIVTWAAALFYMAAVSSAPCETTGTCSVSQVVAVLTLLLMPAQVLLFVWLKQRHDDERD
jgi:membrane protein YdbS with pleckstrin-like domain